MARSIQLQCPAGFSHATGNGTQIFDAERRRSIRGYKSSDEYLRAMKEDLSEWLNSLYELSTTADDLLDHLETGSLLCRHAEKVQQFVNSSASLPSTSEVQVQVQDSKRRSSDPLNLTGSKSSIVGTGADLRQGQVGSFAETLSLNSESRHRCKEPDNNCGGNEAVELAERACWAGLLSAAARSSAQPGSFHSRDNISQFLSWCRRQLLIPDTLLFETEDLVLRKNERSVIFCLVEVARRAVRRCGFPSAPQLIRLEEEIDEELAREESATKTTAAAHQPRKPVIRVDMMSLDEMVREILSRCTCPDMFPMVRVSDGRYRIGDSQTMIFVRILRSYVMVRIGGGWDTLENFLDRHDPCRCQSRGHRIMSATTSFVSSPRSFEKLSTKPTQTPTSSVSSPNAHSSRETSSCASPTSFVTSVQTSGAWTVHESSMTSRMTPNDGVVQRHRRLQPKTPSTDCFKESQSTRQAASKMTSEPSAEHRTPLLKTTQRVTESKSALPLHKRPITPVAVTSKTVKRPITPVAVSSKTVAVGSTRADQKTVRDVAIKKVVLNQRRAPTPDLLFQNKTDTDWSSSRSRVQTRRSVADTSNSDSSTRGRQKSRSSSAGPQHVEQKSRMVDESYINGHRHSQNRRVSFEQSRAPEDPRRTSVDRSNPHTMIVRRSVDGRHSIGDHVTREEERTASPIRVATVCQQNTEHQPRRLSVEKPHQTRNSPTSPNVRFSMTTHLLPSKMQVPQRRQCYSGGDTDRPIDGIIDGVSNISASNDNTADSSSRGPVRRSFSVGDTVVGLDDFGSKPMNGLVHRSSTIEDILVRKNGDEVFNDVDSSTKNGYDGMDENDLVQLTHAEIVHRGVYASSPRQDIGTPDLGKKSAELVKDGSVNHFALNATVSSGATDDQSSIDDQHCKDEEQHAVLVTPKRCDSFQTLIESMPDIEPPQNTEELNTHMEMLFEEYRKVELGLMDLIWKANNEVGTFQQESNATNEVVQRSENGKATKNRKLPPSRGEPVKAKHIGGKSHVAGRPPVSPREKGTKEQLKPSVRRPFSGTVAKLEHSSAVNHSSVVQRTPRWASSLSSLSSRPTSAQRKDSPLKENAAQLSITPTTSDFTRTSRKSGTPMSPMPGTTEKIGRQHQTPITTAPKVNGVHLQNGNRYRSQIDDRGSLKRSVSATLDFRASSDDFVGGVRLCADFERSTSRPDCSGKKSDCGCKTFMTSPALGGQCRQRSYSRSALNDDMPATRIPLPVGSLRRPVLMTSSESGDERLNRADSGVDINNMT